MNWTDLDSLLRCTDIDIALYKFFFIPMLFITSIIKTIDPNPNFQTSLPRDSPSWGWHVRHTHHHADVVLDSLASASVGREQKQQAENSRFSLFLHEGTSQRSVRNISLSLYLTLSGKLRARRRASRRRVVQQTGKIKRHHVAPVFTARWEWIYFRSYLLWRWTISGIQLKLTVERWRAIWRFSRLKKNKSDWKKGDLRLIVILKSNFKKCKVLLLVIFNIETNWQEEEASEFAITTMNHALRKTEQMWN